MPLGSDGMGRVLMLVGGGIFLSGVVLSLLARTSIGRLPGDVVVERGNFTFYFPIVTSILISLILTGVLWLFRR